MKTKLMVLMFLAGGALAAAPRFYVGVGFGGGYYRPYYAPAAVSIYSAPPVAPAYVAPPMPGPGYSWVGGYYYPVGARWSWRAGYWARPPYAHSVWVGPRWSGGRYYGGYWRR